MKKLKFSREFKIGFFGVAMLALLYWGINFLKSKDLFASDNEYYAVYDQVNGLQPSASIVIKGFKVGTVSSMSYDPSKSQNVVVTFAVKSKYPIPKDSKALIYSDGIMGGKAIEIVLGSSPEMLQPGDTLYSEINKDFLETAGSEFEFIKQRANDVISRLTVTLDNLNAILADNRAGLNTTVNNMASITGNLNEVMTEEKGSLRNIIANLNSLSQMLKDKEGQIDNILTNVDRFSDSLRQSKFPTAIAEMTQTLDQLNATLNKVNSGEGTIGKFVNDQALYDSLVDASANLSALLHDIKANPKRYINISVFGGGRNRE